jgi:hypothetical protein
MAASTRLEGTNAMKDLTVILENRPGRLADLGEATGRAGINIEGYAAPPRAARA